MFWDVNNSCFFWHKVEPNQEFRGLVCENANVLPSKFIQEAFQDGFGTPLACFFFILMLKFNYLFESKMDS